MKIIDILKEKNNLELEPLKIRIDNPGGEWLQNKRKVSLEYGLDQYQFFKMIGATTGTFNREAFLPLSLLSTIKGKSGEQEKVRSSDLSWLRNHFKTTGKLPPSDAYSHGEYPPLILVDQRGIPSVYEGNHRIMAAASEGLDVLPVTIRYFNGGEDENGILHPDKVIKLDKQLLDKGYEYGKYKL